MRIRMYGNIAKRIIISFFVIVSVTFAACISYTKFACAAEEMELKRISFCLQDGTRKEYSVLVKNNIIYADIATISEITGFQCHLYDESGDMWWERTYEAFTVIEIVNGVAECMSKEYAINVIPFYSTYYLPLEQMLYLTHCSWSVDNNTVYVMRLGDNILDYYNLYEMKIYDIIPITEDLLVNGESNFMRVFRTALTSYIRNFDGSYYIPIWGAWNGIEKDYLQVLMSLESLDCEILTDEDYEYISQGNIIEMASEDFGILQNIAETPETISDIANWLKDNTQILNRINPNWDFDSLKIPQIKATAIELGDAGTITSIISSLIDVSREYNQIEKISDSFKNMMLLLQNTSYNGIIENTISDAAEELYERIDSKKDNLLKASEDMVIDLFSLICDAAASHSVVGASVAVVKASDTFCDTVFENYHDSTSIALLSSETHSIMQIQSIAIQEMYDTWARISSSKLDNMEPFTDEDIIKLRTCIELTLRCCVRSWENIYNMNLLDAGPDWKQTEDAYLVKQNILWSYYYLEVLESTSGYDDWIVLENNDLSQEFGEYREMIPMNILQMLPCCEIDLSTPYYIKNIDTSLVMNCYVPQITDVINGTVVNTYSFTADRTQQFYFSEIGEGKYSIDTENGMYSIQVGTNDSGYYLYCSDESAAVWKTVQSDDGIYFRWNEDSNLVLTAAQDGRLLLLPWGGSGGQLWEFVTVEEQINPGEKIPASGENVDIASHLTTVGDLVNLLNMNPGERDGIYERDGFYLDISLGMCFSARNESSSYVKLFGYNLGDNILDIERTLLGVGWHANGYDSDSRTYIYHYHIDTIVYMLIIKTNESDNMVYWDVNNFPEGDYNPSYSYEYNLYWDEDVYRGKVTLYSVYNKIVEEYRYSREAQNGASVQSYSLYDIDQDGILELLIYFGVSYQGSVLRIYTCINGEAVLLKELDGWHKSAYGSPDSGIVLVTNNGDTYDGLLMKKEETECEITGIGTINEGYLMQLTKIPSYMLSDQSGLNYLQSFDYLYYAINQGKEPLWPYKTPNALEYKTPNALEYKTEEHEYEFRTATDILYYTRYYKHPYFDETCSTAVRLNQRYQDLIRGSQFYSGDIEADYETCVLLGSTSNLPYYDNMDVEITYNDKGYISLREEYESWSGGGHNNYIQKGIIWDIENAVELTFEDILEGTASQREVLGRYYLEKACGSQCYVTDLFNNPYYLTQDGICFNVCVGSAVPPVEVVIPYTDKDTCIISVEKALLHIGYPCQSLEEE